jgi:hypothetical protein
MPKFALCFTVRVASKKVRQMYVSRSEAMSCHEIIQSTTYVKNRSGITRHCCVPSIPQHKNCDMSVFVGLDSYQHIRLFVAVLRKLKIINIFIRSCRDDGLLGHVTMWLSWWLLMFQQIMSRKETQV